MKMQHQQTIYRNYDIRGAYPDEIDTETVRDIGRALVDIYGARTVVVGYDNRPSAKPLFEALTSGILEQGSNVTDLGLVTTPMLNFAAGSSDAEVGVMITASHMPSGFNGLKICIEDAVPIGIDSGLAELRDYVANGNFKVSDTTGKITSIDIKPQWRARLKQLAPLHSEKTTKVVVDPANAVGILELETLHQYNSLQITSIYDTLDHTAPHHEANPMKLETLDDLGHEVVKRNADIGIAFDGDADRIGIVDENGNAVPQDMVGLLVAEELLRRHGSELVFYDVRSSKRVKEAVEAAGGSARSVRVGHSYIRHAMREHNAIFALELSGHHFFRDMHFSEGGVLPALMLIEMLKKSSKTLSELVAEHQVYHHSGEINSEVTRSPEDIYDALIAKFPDAEIDRTDGLTLTFNDWWCNVRPSATDPVIRLNLEADTKERMEEMREKTLSIIRDD